MSNATMATYLEDGDLVTVGEDPSIYKLVEFLGSDGIKSFRLELFSKVASA